MNKTFCSNPHALHFTPIEEKPSPDSLETPSPAPYSFCIFKRAISHCRQTAQGRLLGIDWSARIIHAGTFQEKTNDKNIHPFSFKCTVWKDQAGLLPWKPAPKWLLQHHIMSRLLILNMARCFVAKGVLLI